MPHGNYFFAFISDFPCYQFMKAALIVLVDAFKDRETIKEGMSRQLMLQIQISEKSLPVEFLISLFLNVITVYKNQCSYVFNWIPLPSLHMVLYPVFHKKMEPLSYSIMCLIFTSLL